MAYQFQEQFNKYLDFSQVRNFLKELEQRYPNWCKLEVVGTTEHGSELFLLIIGQESQDSIHRPAIWLDAGTHAEEWAGVSSILYSAQKWCDEIEKGINQDWFLNNTVYLYPCVCPDSYDAMIKGKFANLRSLIKESKREESNQKGFREMDLDGDGVTRFMRFKHPSGNLVKDDSRDYKFYMRKRTIDDDENEAYFLLKEGEFINWDGETFNFVNNKNNVDLNINFPSSWKPEGIFGMTTGQYTLSEVESRTLIDTFSSKKYICAALTYHTFSGVLLSQPYREEHPFTPSDLKQFEHLGKNLLKDTKYKFISVLDDFIYDKKKKIGGVWSDTISSTFGIPGYTLEIWNPYEKAGIDVKDFIKEFMNPEEENFKKLMEYSADMDPTYRPFKEYNHPQLGKVEVGGFDPMRTIRNPPEKELLNECQIVHLMADRLRKMLPKVKVKTSVKKLGEGDLFQVNLFLENSGFLSTAVTEHAKTLEGSPTMGAIMNLSGDQCFVTGDKFEKLEHLSGWSKINEQMAINPIFSKNSMQPFNLMRVWVIQGKGEIKLDLNLGFAGMKSVKLNLGK